MKLDKFIQNGQVMAENQVYGASREASGTKPNGGYPVHTQEKLTKNQITQLTSVSIFVILTFVSWASCLPMFVYIVVCIVFPVCQKRYLKATVHL
jgi:hypothetical protein